MLIKSIVVLSSQHRMAKTKKIGKISIDKDVEQHNLGFIHYCWNPKLSLENSLTVSHIA
jgi:hypothetical protein